ncbi:MAG: hypothetical protein GY711_04125 [bacterium]|nr:hypothetical protein [bacterium]
MKTTLFAGLLLAGASIPALQTGDAEARSAEPVSMPAPQDPDDRTTGLRAELRELESAMRLIERQVELEHLERSMQMRREYREERRNLARMARDIESRRETTEVSIARALQDASRKEQIAADKLDREIERATDDFGARKQLQAKELELHLRDKLQAAAEDEPKEADLRRLEVEYESQLLAHEHDLQKEQQVYLAKLHEEGQARIAQLTEEQAALQEHGIERLREYEDELMQYEERLQAHDEDSEAELELHALKDRMKAEGELDVLARKRDELREHLERTQRGHVDRGGGSNVSLERVHGALEQLQDEVAGLRRDVDALTKAVSGR